MRQIEARFTLFDPGSDLRRLNRLGRAPLGADLDAVLTVARAVHDGEDDARKLRPGAAHHDDQDAGGDRDGESGQA